MLAKLSFWWGVGGEGGGWALGFHSMGFGHFLGVS